MTDPRARVARLHKLAEYLAQTARDWNAAAVDTEERGTAAATMQAARDVAAAADRLSTLRIDAGLVADAVQSNEQLCAALELVRLTLNNEGGVDLTDTQMLATINSALDNAVLTDHPSLPVKAFYDNWMAAEGLLEKAEVEIERLKQERDAALSDAKNDRRFAELTEQALTEARQRIGELVEAVQGWNIAFANRGETTSLHTWNEGMKAAKAVGLKALVTANMALPDTLPQETGQSSEDEKAL